MPSTFSSAEQPYRKNRFGDDPSRIKRVGIPVLEYNDKIQYFGGRYLCFYLEEYTGSSRARAIRQALKLLTLVKMAIGKKG